jgi:hypothetical protein
MRTATLITTLALCSVALGLPSGVLNHEPMTEEKLQELVKLHMAGVSVEPKHNDPVVSGFLLFSFFLLTSFCYFLFFLYVFFAYFCSFFLSSVFSFFLAVFLIAVSNP